MRSAALREKQCCVDRAPELSLALPGQALRKMLDTVLGEKRALEHSVASWVRRRTRTQATVASGDLVESTEIVWIAAAQVSVSRASSVLTSGEVACRSIYDKFFARG